MAVPLAAPRAAGDAGQRPGAHRLSPGRQSPPRRAAQPRTLFSRSAPGRARGTGARALPLARPQPARARAALVCVAGAPAPADSRRGRRDAGRAQRPAGDVAGAALHGPRRRRRLGAAVPEAQGHLHLPGAEPSGARRGTAARPAAPGQRRDLLARRSRQGAAAGDPPRRRLLQPARHGLRHPRRRLRAVLRRAGDDAARAVAHGPRARHGGAAGGRRDPARRRRLPRALRGAVGRLPDRRRARRQRPHEPLDRERDPPQPAQYLWVHRRFKTRPPGEPPLY